MIKKIILLATALQLLFHFGLMAQSTTPVLPSGFFPLFPTPANVDFDAYEKLVKEVKAHRRERMINIESFSKMSREQNVVILDTRSDSMYHKMHIKGAIHLNFADFTQANLQKLIPDPNTRILIYCNNNFSDDTSLVSNDFRPLLEYVPTKAALPKYMMNPIPNSSFKKNTSPTSEKSTASKSKSTVQPSNIAKPKPQIKTTEPSGSVQIKDKQLTLALNIPTYINLYGYGYKNVYELSELIYISQDPRIDYEGTAVNQVMRAQMN